MFPSQLHAALAGLPLSARLHLALRWKVFPFPALADYIPSNGEIVDLGCGQGLWAFYLAASFPQVRIWGIDPDEAKILQARQIAGQLNINNVFLDIGSAQGINYPPCDIVTLIDVLYLVPFEQQEKILIQAKNRLRSGGRLLLKEMSCIPRWKYAWNWLEEWLAVRVFGITYGKKFYFRSDQEWVELLNKLGFSVQINRLDKGFLHPHILFIGETS